MAASCVESDREIPGIHPHGSLRVCDYQAVLATFMGAAFRPCFGVYDYRAVIVTWQLHVSRVTAILSVIRHVASGVRR